MKESKNEILPLVIPAPLTEDGLRKLLNMIAWGRNRRMLEAERAAKGQEKDS